MLIKHFLCIKNGYFSYEVAQAKAAMILSAYGIDHKARSDVGIEKTLTIYMIFFIRY
jgi:hypothetical protein